ncbi:hypothetical protein N7490_009413 [Penicillium lividum]|nr:hypothetical protein N7490_009413 [Penicillium lividum]
MLKFYTDETPEVVQHATADGKKGLHLITCSTPNGKKVQLFLEELKDIYGLEWTTSLIDIDTDKQKEPCEPPFPVFESSAELLCLPDTVDKDHHFGFSIPKNSLN